MSCTKNGQRCANAAKRNGIVGQTSRYLNTLGSWSSYRNLDSPEKIPAEVAKLTARFFGLDGLFSGHPGMMGLMGVVMAVHGLEQVTASIVTTGMRLYGRGRPLAQYNGIIIRDSPSTLKQASKLNRIVGGRILAAKGYYFMEGGRTWHSESITVQVGDMPRTFTKVRSYSIPHREYYFDRPVYIAGLEEDPPEDERAISMQRVIDIIRGDEDPDMVPGFMGSVNELEDITGLMGTAKRAFFAASWLLIDEGERDRGPADYVDYEALIQGTAPGSTKNGTTILGGGRSSAGQSPILKPIGTNSPGLPNFYYAPNPGYSTPTTTTPQSYGADLFGNRATPMARPKISLSNLPGYKPFENDSRVYPLIVKNVLHNPLKPLDPPRAEAVYYDASLGKWRIVVDDNDKEEIAQKVKEGLIRVTPQNEWPENADYY